MPWRGVPRLLPRLDGGLQLAVYDSFYELDGSQLLDPASRVLHITRGIV